ncbi:hypothetical protein [Ponticoccus alexandrii]|uniref:DUF2946 domain-containing protein n=1 Tax=Ponticoccus alexandrii TaxID=1943633 RepID=A0ABX7FD49_9RHOB|nr:hypothetical protein [Ponticoccus alexandrii]QRF67747.1 hypothetical protein GQA70_16410 [Ponticoccus alexandrii]
MHRLLVVLFVLAIAVLAAVFPGAGQAAPHGGQGHAGPAHVHTVSEANPRAVLPCDDCGMTACPMADCLQEALPPELMATGGTGPSPERSATLCRSPGVETEVLVPPPRFAASPAFI